MKITQILKNSILSPILIARAIIAGIAGIAYEVQLLFKREYDAEGVLLILVILIEFALSVGSFVLAPRLLPASPNFYHIGAAVMWYGFVALYSFMEREWQRSAGKEPIWEYLGDTAPLFVIGTDAIILLILGIIL